MPRAVPPVDPRVRRTPPSDVALLRANTPESVEALADHYWSRGLQLARSILDSDEAAARVVAEAAGTLTRRLRDTRAVPGPVRP